MVQDDELGEGEQAREREGKKEREHAMGGNTLCF